GTQPFRQASCLRVSSGVRRPSASRGRSRQGRLGPVPCTARSPASRLPLRRRLRATSAGDGPDGSATNRPIHGDRGVQRPKCRMAYEHARMTIGEVEEYLQPNGEWTTEEPPMPLPGMDEEAWDREMYEQDERSRVIPVAVLISATSRWQFAPRVAAGSGTGEP